MGRGSSPAGRVSKRSVRKARLWLKETYPKAFSEFVPLVVGVRQMVLARPVPKRIGRRAIREAIMGRVRHDKYLLALSKPGAWRVDLDGAPRAPVIKAHAKSARAFFFERQRLRQEARRPPMTRTREAAAVR